MRVVLAAVFACALGVPVASALPAFGPHAPSFEKTSPIVQVAKRGKATARRQGRSHGGIHSLVGSGDY